MRNSTLIEDHSRRESSQIKFSNGHLTMNAIDVYVF